MNNICENRVRFLCNCINVQCKKTCDSKAVLCFCILINQADFYDIISATKRKDYRPSHWLFRNTRAKALGKDKGRINLQFGVGTIIRYGGVVKTVENFLLSKWLLEIKLI